MRKEVTQTNIQCRFIQKMRCLILLRSVTYTYLVYRVYLSSPRGYLLERYVNSTDFYSSISVYISWNQFIEYRQLPKEILNLSSPNP